MKVELLPAFFDELEQWAEERHVPVETVAYGDHPDQVVDLRVPAGTGPHRLAFVLHGGFWRSGYTRRNTTALAVALTAAGWASANVEYRRLGPGAYRSLLDDVGCARGLLEDLHPVVAVGHSSGGQLGLWLAAEGLVDGSVALGGVCDLALAARAGLGEGAVQEFLGGDPADAPDAYLAADPAARLPHGVPQILVHGVDDDRVPIDHAGAYAARARAAGDECRVLEVAAGHFELIDPRSHAWPQVLHALELADTAMAAGEPR